MSVYIHMCVCVSLRTCPSAAQGGAQGEAPREARGVVALRVPVLPSGHGGVGGAQHRLLAQGTASHGRAVLHRPRGKYQEGEVFFGALCDHCC